MSNIFNKLKEVLSSLNEEKIKEILMKSRKPTLSDAERVILENIDEDYKWIARDECGRLNIFASKPKKYTNFWNGNVLLGINAFNHLFQFIKWENEQPYNIEELLKGE